jgi:hypothetical protein
VEGGGGNGSLFGLLFLFLYPLSKRPRYQATMGGAQCTTVVIQCSVVNK